MPGSFAAWRSSGAGGRSYRHLIEHSAGRKGAPGGPCTLGAFPSRGRVPAKPIRKVDSDEIASGRAGPRRCFPSQRWAARWSLAGCGSSNDVSNAITDAGKQIKKATKETSKQLNKATKEIQKQGNKALNKAQKQGNKTLNEAQKQLNKAQKKINKKVPEAQKKLNKASKDAQKAIDNAGY